MTKPKLEVADVFRSLDPAFVSALPATQRRVVQDIVACRTAALGGHVEQCDQCGYCQIAYNSCRNRHCPKCQAAARAEWMEARAEELLPVPYFHIVFTLPEQLSPLALQNKRIIYNLLFKATSETLLEIAADPQHLGARIGFFAVLHSWGQTLQAHPHLHCVIPGGGLSADNSQWIACRPGFFLPVKVLSRLFRGKFVAFLREARKQDRLTYAGQLSALAEGEEFNHWLRELSRIEWVVYALCV
jgi:Transposase zinc-binding domain/Putative transposase